MYVIRPLPVTAVQLMRHWVKCVLCNGRFLFSHMYRPECTQLFAAKGVVEFIMQKVKQE